MISSVVEQARWRSPPLAHAAGELVRVGAQALRGGRDADALQHLGCARTRGVFAHLLVCADRLDHLGTMRSTGLSVIIGSGRSSRCGRRAAGAAARRRTAQGLRLEQDAPAGDATGGVDQPHDGKAGDGLAAARLADQSEHFAFATVKLTSSTAFTTPARVKKCVRRFSTCRITDMIWNRDERPMNADEYRGKHAAR